MLSFGTRNGARHRSYSVNSLYGPRPGQNVAPAEDFNKANHVEYMEQRQLKTLIGVAMVGLGLVQAGAFALQSKWLPMVLGLLYAVIGTAYLWAEVYTAGQ